MDTMDTAMQAHQKMMDRVAKPQPPSDKMKQTAAQGCNMADGGKCPDM